MVSEGNETELTCTAIGSKPAASIRWMKGEEELTGAWTNSLPRFPYTPTFCATELDRMEQRSPLRSINGLKS